MISNTITLRKYFLWSSQWFCDYNYYSLLFEDIKITNYLQSIFFSLKYPTSHFIIKRYVYKVVIQSTFYILFWFRRHLNKNKIFFFFRKHKRYLINHFAFKKSVYFFTKRICNKLYFYIYKSKKCKFNYLNSFFINYNFLKKTSLNKNLNFFLKLIKKHKYLYKNRYLLKSILNLLRIKSFLLKKSYSFLSFFLLSNNRTNNNINYHHIYDDDQLSFSDAFYSYLSRLYNRKYYNIRTKMYIDKLRKAVVNYNYNMSKNVNYYFQNDFGINLSESFFFTSLVRSKLLLKRYLVLPKYIESKKSILPLFIFNTFFYYNSQIKKKNKKVGNIFSFMKLIIKKIKKIRKKKEKKKVLIKPILLDNKYNYFLANYYLSNKFNFFNKVSFFKKKYISIYYFLKKYTFSTLNVNISFTINNKNYYFWTFYILKFNSFFYNKFFSMYITNMYHISFKLLKIVYYYSLILYKINKLFFFINWIRKKSIPKFKSRFITTTLISKKKVNFIKNTFLKLNKSKTFVFFNKHVSSFNSFISFKNYVNKKCSKISNHLMNAEKLIFSLNKYNLSSIKRSYRTFLKYYNPIFKLNFKKKNSFVDALFGRPKSDNDSDSVENLKAIYSFISFDRNNKCNKFIIFRNAFKKKKRLYHKNLLYLLVLYIKKNKYLFRYYKKLNRLFFRKKKLKKFIDGFIKRKNLINNRILKIKNRIIKLASLLRKYKKYISVFRTVLFSKNLKKNIKKYKINVLLDKKKNFSMKFCKKKKISWTHYFLNNFNLKKKKTKSQLLLTKNVSNNLLYFISINENYKSSPWSYLFTLPVRKMRKLFLFFLLYKSYSVYYHKQSKSLLFERNNNKWDVFSYYNDIPFFSSKKICIKKNKISSKLINIWFVKFKYIKKYISSIYFKMNYRLRRKLRRMYNKNHYFLNFLFFLKSLFFLYQIMNDVISTLFNHKNNNKNVLISGNNKKNNNISNNIVNNKSVFFFIYSKIGLKLLFNCYLTNNIIKFQNWFLLRKNTTLYMKNNLISNVNARLYNFYLKNIVFRKKKIRLKINIKYIHKKKVFYKYLVLNTKVYLNKKITFSDIKLLSSNSNDDIHDSYFYFIHNYNKLNINHKSLNLFYKKNNVSYINKHIYVNINKPLRKYYSTFLKNDISLNKKNNTRNNNFTVNTSNTTANKNSTTNINGNKNAHSNETNNKNIKKKNKKKKMYSRNSSSHDIFLRRPVIKKKRKHLQRLLRLQQNKKLQFLLYSYKNVRDKTKFIKHKYSYYKNTLSDFKKLLKIKKIKKINKKKKKFLNILNKNSIFKKYISEYINRDTTTLILNPTELYFKKKEMIRQWRQQYYRGNTRFSINVNDEYYVYIEKKNLFLLFKNYFTYFFLHGCGISSIYNNINNNVIHLNTSNYFIYFYLYINKHVFINTFSFVKYIHFLCKNKKKLLKRNYLLLCRKIKLYYCIKFRKLSNRIFSYNVNLFSFIFFYKNTNYFINSFISFHLFRRFKFYFNLNLTLNKTNNNIISFYLNPFKIKNKEKNSLLFFIEYFTSVFYILHKSIYGYVTKLFSFYIKKRKISKATFFKHKYHSKPRRSQWKNYHNEEHSLMIQDQSFDIFTINSYIYNFNIKSKHYSYSSYFSFYKNSFDLNYFYFYTDQLNKMSFVSTKSWVFMSWIWKNKFSSFINGIIFIIKLLFFIHIKKKKNLSLVILMRSVLEYLFNNNISVNLYNYYNNIINIYFHYITKTYSIDYFYEVILKFILQNKSYYLYYLKYYILNFIYLFYYIELTISKYINNNCFLLINYSMRWKYYLNSAKMWCEYIAYFLKKKLTIRKLFFFIKKQQKVEKNRMMYDYLAKKNQNIFLHKFKYALRGIRITYSGNFKKAKRKKKLYYYVWLSNDKYTGKMPLKKYKFFIDYYSTSVSLKRSNVGIKFWLLFNIF